MMENLFTAYLETGRTEGLDMTPLTSRLYLLMSQGQRKSTGQLVPHL